MSFILSLLIIIGANYLALSIFWLRHRKEIINRPIGDFSDDLSVLNFRKKKKDKKADPDPVESEDSDDLCSD